MKVAVPLAKNILAPLGITAAASAIDGAIQKKIHGSCRPSDFASRKTTLIIPNKEMNDIIKNFQTLEDFNILLKGLLKELKMKQKNKKGGF